MSQLVRRRQGWTAGEKSSCLWKKLHVLHVEEAMNMRVYVCETNDQETTGLECRRGSNTKNREINSKRGTGIAYLRSMN